MSFSVYFRINSKDYHLGEIKNESDVMNLRMRMIEVVLLLNEINTEKLIYIKDINNTKEIFKWTSEISDYAIFDKNVLLKLILELNQPTKFKIEEESKQKILKGFSKVLGENGFSFKTEPELIQSILALITTPPLVKPELRVFYDSKDLKVGPFEEFIGKDASNILTNLPIMYEKYNNHDFISICERVNCIPITNIIGLFGFIINQEWSDFCRHLSTLPYHNEKSINSKSVLNFLQRGKKYEVHCDSPLLWKLDDFSVISQMNFKVFFISGEFVSTMVPCTNKLASVMSHLNYFEFQFMLNLTNETMGVCSISSENQETKHYHVARDSNYIELMNLFLFELFTLRTSLKNFEDFSSSQSSNIYKLYQALKTQYKENIKIKNI